MPFSTLPEAVKGADVLVGLSIKGAFTAAMLKSMATRPIVFAMRTRIRKLHTTKPRPHATDIIMATGSSNYPSQVNNALRFPFIFRGALDVHATAINEEMKLAATRALADLAREDVPDSVCRAYGVERLSFGADYIIPRPFDPRVLVWEASAIARAAMETGVAQESLDITEYRQQLEKRLGKAHGAMRSTLSRHDPSGSAGNQSARGCPSSFWTVCTRHA